MKIYRLKIPRLKIPEYFQTHRKSRCGIKITNIKTPSTIVFTNALLLCLVINSFLCTHVDL